MFFHLKSLLYAILFLAIFQVVFFNENLIWQAGIFLVFFSLWSAKRIGGKYSFSIIPVIFSVSSVILLYLIDFPADQQAFIILASLVFYFILLGIFRLKSYSKDQTARGIASGGLLATIFFFYTGFYGIYINFSIPLWVLMFVFLAITFILSYHYLGAISPDKKKVLSFSVILGFAMAEISWVINFWPFGYLTTGVIALIFYYMFWDLAQSYFTKKLSKRKITFNLIFFSLLIGLILLTSRWQLAV
jgi:hypothetical protein